MKTKRIRHRGFPSASPIQSTNPACGCLTSEIERDQGAFNRVMARIHSFRNSDNYKTQYIIQNKSLPRHKILNTVSITI